MFSLAKSVNGWAGLEGDESRERERDEVIDEIRYMLQRTRH